MKKYLFAVSCIAAVCLLCAACAQSGSGDLSSGLEKKGLKVMIGVDFEGVTNVVVFPEIYAGHIYFERNQKQLTDEVNAAVEGALAAGATEVIVRDGHGADQNIDPVGLHPKAKLVNGRIPNTPQTMVYGIDSTYDALVFIGAHAMAGKTNGVLSHTMSLKVLDYKMNGVSMGECPYNALYAGQFGVPVVFVAGDDVTCAETKQILGENIATVQTKKAIGRTAAMNNNAQEVCANIKREVEKALKGLPESGVVYTLKKPYKMEVWVNTEADGSPVKATGKNPLMVNGVPARYVTKTSDTLLVALQEFWDNI